MTVILPGYDGRGNMACSAPSDLGDAELRVFVSESCALLGYELTDERWDGRTVHSGD